MIQKKKISIVFYKNLFMICFDVFFIFTFLIMIQIVIKKKRSDKQIFILFFSFSYVIVIVERKTSIPLHEK